MEPLQVRLLYNCITPVAHFFSAIHRGYNSDPGPTVADMSARFLPEFTPKAIYPPEERIVSQPLLFRALRSRGDQSTFLKKWRISKFFIKNDNKSFFLGWGKYVLPALLQQESQEFFHIFVVGGCTFLERAILYSFEGGFL